MSPFHSSLPLTRRIVRRDRLLFYNGHQGTVQLFQIKTQPLGIRVIGNKK